MAAEPSSGGEAPATPHLHHKKAHHPHQAPPATEPAAPAVAETAPVPVHGHKAAASASKPLPKRIESAPALDAISSWWTPVAKQSTDHLNLVYAGEAAFDKAIVLLFSSDMDAGAGSHIDVLDASGKTVSGTWEVGSNPHMLIFKTAPGRYTIALRSDLVDAHGKALDDALHGPVYVH
jgi:hypothetical protein